MEAIMEAIMRAINLKDDVMNKRNAGFRVKHFVISDLEFPCSSPVSVVLELLPFLAFIIYVKALTRLAFTA